MVEQLPRMQNLEQPETRLLLRGEPAFKRTSLFQPVQPDKPCLRACLLPVDELQVQDFTVFPEYLG